VTDERFEKLMRKHKKATVGMCKYTWKEGTGNIVECDTLTTCNRCGWNPEVAKRRAAVIRKELLNEE